MDVDSERRLDVMKGCFAALAAQDLEALVAHYAEDYVLELPYFKPAEALVIEGRSAVREYLVDILGRQRMTLEITTVHPIVGERLLIAEYTSSGEFCDDGAPYSNRYVGYWYFDEASDGGARPRVRRLREYYNPQAPRASAIG